MTLSPSLPFVAIVGAGPAGLMAAEVLSQAGIPTHVFDAMPSVGRKFLLAGIGGLNITHNEDYEPFCSRYAERAPELRPALDGFTPAVLRQWVHELGVDTFVGTSGRVFPKEMKAAPLLRAWVQRLRADGVQFHMRHRWVGWNPAGELVFEVGRLGEGATAPIGAAQNLAAIAAAVPQVASTTAGPELAMRQPESTTSIRPTATILALGGASWPKLGSTGAWVPWLAERGVQVAPLYSANCGFEVTWSPYLRERFAGAPLKTVALSFTDLQGHTERRVGELIISEQGVEGSLIYAYSKRLREAILAHGHATFTLDLAPTLSMEQVRAELQQPRGSRSLSSFLQSRLGFKGVKVALLHEILDKSDLQSPEMLAQTIKLLPITVHATRPLAEAISTAGGVCFESLDEHLMIRSLPGTFVAGEMLDWEAPTGGYLLTACWATGRQAGLGAQRWVSEGYAIA